MTARKRKRGNPKLPAKTQAARIKERIFVREYVKDLNAQRAYVAAGYGAKAACSGASRMLARANIKEMIDKAVAKIEVNLEISAERNLKRIAEIAYAKPLAKHADILRACELIGKHFKMFTDVQEHHGKDGNPIQVIVTLPANGSEVTEK